MSNTTVDLNPSDIAGAVQRGLSELHAYMQQPAHAIDVQASQAHLVRLDALLQTLSDMQRAYARQAASTPAANGEARPS